MQALMFYDIIYLMSNVVAIYSKRAFLCIFFDRCKINKKAEAILFICYFIINGFIYISFRQPLLNLLNNIVILFLLTFIYDSFILKKIIAVVIVYISCMIVETLVFYIIRFILPNYNDLIFLAILISSIVIYFIVLLIKNLTNLKSNYKLSFFYNLIILAASSISIYISAVLILMYERFRGNSVHIIISLGGIILLDILIIYIYDMLNIKYEIQLEKRLLENQMDFHTRQLETMNQSNEVIDFLRHDMKNHFIAVNSIVPDNAELNRYISNLLKSIGSSREFAKSGNIVIDSILNYKFQEAADKDIELELELKIPMQLNIQNSDITVLLGNLFDNAIEASSKAQSKKIKVLIYLEKDILCINIVNTYSGALVMEEDTYITTRENKENHGLGLLSVKHAIKKYNGAIDISHTDSSFSVKVLIYNI